jgi:hypothetical protein
MGYSIMTPFENVEAQNKMLLFLEENYQDYTKVFSVNKKVKEPYHPSLPRIDLNYGPRPEIPVIGFDYGAGTDLDDREYAFLICYWMAVHGGARKNFQQYGNMPYVIYDGVEDWALFVNEKSQSEIECVSVDGVGFRPTVDLLLPATGVLRLIIKTFSQKQKKNDQIMKKELIRLNSIYK